MGHQQLMEPRPNRLPSFIEVLDRKTKPPVDLFSFYIYMRDQQRSVDYLDFWYVLLPIPIATNADEYGKGSMSLSIHIFAAILLANCVDRSWWRHLTSRKPHPSARHTFWTIWATAMTPQARLQNLTTTKS